MKKFCKLAIILSLVFVNILMPFSNIISSTTSVNESAVVYAEERASDFSTLSKAISITQDGYVFSEADFEYNEQENKYFLYVNTTITITNNAIYSLKVSMFDSDGYSAELYDVTFGTYKNQPTLTSMQSCAIAYNGASENVYHVVLDQLNANSLVLKSFEFYLIQTPVNFDIETNFAWTDSEGESVISPVSTETFTDYITLSNVIGTVNNPIFVDFYHNGEFYSIYNIGDGYYYNTLTDNKLEQTELKFNVPGQYELYIYDKTCYSAFKHVTYWQGKQRETTKATYLKGSSDYSSYDNIAAFSFTIKQSTANLTNDNMYLIAKDEDGNTIVSDQTVNSKVYINFYNLNQLYVKRIELIEYTPQFVGDNVNKTTIIYEKTEGSQFSYIYKLLETTLVYSEDTSYAINIYDHNDQKIWDDSFKFTILTSIHSSYKELNSHNPALVPKNNTIYSIKQTESHDTQYTGFTEITGYDNLLEQDITDYLTSNTTTTYFVKLARASTGADGISNGSSNAGPVTLTIHGVGEITVTVSNNNSTVTHTYADGSKITLSEVGKYSINIVDEMGTQAYKTFAIKRSFGTATVILIVVSALLVVAFIIIIVRMRTKINVR